MYSMLTPHKLNTQSSTEAELVGINDVLPQILWMQYFLEAHGNGLLAESGIYQDYQSTIL